jgi:hypothetical protein
LLSLQVLKQQRNVMIGAMGFVLFVIFMRFHRMLARADAILDAQATVIRSQHDKTSTDAPKKVVGDVSMREEAEKRGKSKKAD